MTKAARFRLFGILVLAGFVGVSAWLAFRDKKQDTPESLLAYISTRVGEGDGDAFYRMLLAPARRNHEGFVKDLRARPDEAGAIKFREALGLSKTDVQTLTERELLRRETLAFKDAFAGARLVKTHKVDTDSEVVLEVLLRDGQSKWWHLQRVDGVWRIYNHNAILGAQGNLIR